MISILGQSITNDWITLLTTAVVLVFVVVLFWLVLGGSQQALSPVEEQKIDEIASAASVQIESSRARAMELLAETLKKQTEVSPEALPELIKELETKLGTIAARLGPTREADPIQPLVTDLVNEYQRQALSQSKVQFWISIAAAVVGFGLIGYVVVSAARDGANALELAVRSAPGVLMEAVAVLFFNQARETR